MIFEIFKYFSDTSLLNLFMAIVYCKPDIVALHQLTKFLGTASKKCCNELCRRKSNGIMNFPRSCIRRYSSDSCPLQVYASLLEVIFQPNESFKTTPDFIFTLTQITIGLMTFLRNCFKCSVNWLFRRSDCDSEQQQQICYCYCYIVSATIVLLHLCIKYWIEDQKCIGKFVESTLFSIDKIEFFFKICRYKNHGSSIQNGCNIFAGQF